MFLFQIKTHEIRPYFSWSFCIRFFFFANYFTSIYGSLRRPAPTGNIKMESPGYTDTGVCNWEEWRQENLSHFLRINLVKPQQSKSINFADEQPGQGKNYYKLKGIYLNASTQFTPAIIVIIGQHPNNWLLYQVPVREVLNLQCNGTAPISGVIAVFIQSAAGRAFHKLRFSSNTRLISIPVANLGKGVYDISIVVKGKIMWNQRFVKWKFGHCNLPVFFPIFAAS